MAARGLEQTGDQKRAPFLGNWGLFVAPLPPSGILGPLAGQVREVLGLAEGARILPLISLGRGRSLRSWKGRWVPPTSEQPELSWNTRTPGGPGLLQGGKGWAGAMWSLRVLGCPCVVQFPSQPGCSCEAGSVRGCMSLLLRVPGHWRSARVKPSPPYSVQTGLGRGGHRPQVPSGP